MNTAVIQSSFTILQEKLRKGQAIKIALAGNPNCGKSTLFNALTGLKQKTGNYPGVTVDKKTGSFKVKNLHAQHGQEFCVIDLPGTYSLFPKSPDEQVTFDMLMQENNTDYPDIIVMVADASNLKRHLLLSTQIIDLQRPCILVLNMIDAALENGIEINFKKLSELLGVPVVACNSRSGEGIHELKNKLLEFSEEATLAPPSIDVTMLANANYVDAVHRHIGQSSPYASLLKQRFQTRQDEKLDVYNKKFFSGFESRDMLFRYEKIKRIILDSTNFTHAGKSLKSTYKIDYITTHPVWGFVVFIGVLFLIFQSIFYLAEIPMQWIEDTFTWLGIQTAERMPSSFFGNMLTNGILPGLGGIVMFVPQIALLFGFIGLLEDSGYMARVSFIMDKLMRKIGLSGRSVIPLISGMACAVPAIMGTRTISNTKERIITILVTPLMSCSARLPVYTLLIGIMIPAQAKWGIFNTKGIILTSLYLLGILAAIGVSALLKLFFKNKENSLFMMELPVYRVPQFKTIALTMLEKVKVFLMDAGKIILIISVVLWFLASYGPSARMQQVERKYEKEVSLSAGKLKGDIKSIEQKHDAAVLENSFAGILGHAIEPVIKPLGFDWKIGIALISSIAAREVFVGTMATLYKGTEGNIHKKMMAEINPLTQKPVYGAATCFSLLLFYAFAMQCMSTLAVVKRETNSWKWPLVQFTYMSVLAYVCSFICYTVLG